MKTTHFLPARLLPILIALALWVCALPARSQTYALGANSSVEGPSAGSDSIELAVTPASSVSWYAIANDPWLTITPATASGTSSGLVFFSFTANTGATRIGTLTVAGQTVTVTQAGAGYMPVTTPTTLVSSLFYPDALALDGSGNVYAAAYLTGAVKEFVVATQSLITLVSSGIWEPYALALDGSGNVYISDRNAGIKVFHPTTQTVSIPPALSQSMGALATDGSGNIWIANTGVVEKYSPATQSVSTLVSGTQFGTATGLALDGSGNAYITDTIGLYQYSATSGTLTTLMPSLDNPKAVALDGSNNIFLVYGGQNYIAEYSPGGASFIGNIPYDTGYSNIGSAVSLASDDAGHIYVGDANYLGVDVFTEANQTFTTLFSAGLNLPSSVAVDGSGNVYFSGGQGFPELREYSPVTTGVTTLVSSGVNTAAGTLAVDGSGNVYFSGTGIEQYSPATQSAQTIFPLPLHASDIVAVDSAGNLYFSGTGIEEYSPSTQSLSTLVPPSNSGATGIAVDLLGNIYFVSGGAIYEYSPFSLAINPIESPGIDGPVSPSVDAEGNIFFLDNSSTSLIKEYSPASQSVTSLNVSGLSYAADAALDTEGNLFIANTSASQIQELPHAFLNASPISELAASGSDALPAVLPATVNLSPPFAPTVDQPWLTLDPISSGTIGFSFTQNTGNTRTANITVFSQSIPVTQSAPYSVTPTSGTNGSISPSTPQGSGPSGGLQFIAYPDTGYTVDQWLVNGVAVQTGGGVFNLTGISADASIEVTFMVQTFTISPSAGPGGSINPDAPFIIDSGSSAVFTSTANPGFVTYQWLFDGAVVQTGGTSCALNDAQNSFPVEVTFIATPVISIGNPSQITDGSALLSGTVNPMGVSTTAMFRYGPTQSYGTTTPAQAMGSSASNVRLTGTLSALTGATTYHYQIVSTGSGLTYYGPDQTFTTLPTPGVLGTYSLAEAPTSGTDSVVLGATMASGTWTAVANNSWLHVAPASASGTGNALIIFTFNTNTGGTRTGTLTIAQQTLTVTQAGSTYEAADFTAVLPMRMRSPKGIAVDGSNNVYVADYVDNTVEEYSPATLTASTLLNLGARAGLNTVAVDGSGNVYFPDNGTIYKYSPVTKSATPLFTNSASGIAVDASGNLYIAYGGQNILKYTHATQSLTTLVSGLTGASGVAVDAAGNLYIADTSANAIREYSQAHGVLSTLLTGQQYPTAIAVDGSGNLYITEFHGDTLDEYFASTGSLAILVSANVNNSYGVAVDGAGNVYYTNYDGSAARELIRAFVNTKPITDPTVSGTASLPVVIPSTLDLTGLLAPSSNSSWLDIGPIRDGVIDYSFAPNYGPARTGQITVLGESINVSQPATYSVTPTSGSNGNIGPVLVQKGIVLGGSANFAAAPAAGYTVYQWLVNGAVAQTGGAFFDLTNVDANATVEVTFIAKPAISAGIPPQPAETSALLTGLVNPKGIDTSASIQYGLSTTYGTSTAVQVLGSGSTALLYSGTAAGLAPATAYHYQLVTTSSAGTFYGPDQTFTTRPVNPVSHIIALQGQAISGAGTGSLTGIPSGSKWFSFGPPSLDNSGNIAFQAQWQIGTATGGPGIFLNTSLLAQFGGTAAGLTGVTYDTFTDPVLDSGNVAFIATLAGPTISSTNESAVFSTAGGKGMTLIARQGELAPGTAGAAVFQSFTSIAVSGSSVAFLAQLQDAPGATSVTSANATALYVDDPAYGLRLFLRQGAVVNSEAIKTLTAFLPGNGSPGQGRGWLLSPGGSPQVLAQVTFTDNTQALLSANIYGIVTAISHTGIAATTGAPQIFGAEFQSYGVPAANSIGGSAFLATLKTGPGGIIASDDAGIFSYNTKLGRYGAAALLSGSAPGGGIFAQFQDTVLAPDSSALAFPATLSGPTISGAAASTLWWVPAGGLLTPLARGGVPTLPQQQPPGVASGAQWTAFNSLGIAGGFGDGPVFSASLAPGLGGIPAGGASGVWGISSTGALSELFQTGTALQGRTIKSFTFLTAVTGSPGVARWLNDSGQSVWLATFMDGTQAIVETQSP